MRPLATVVIPARNEEERIGETVQAAKRVHPSAEVLVIDDGSTDRTAEEARLSGADRVLSLKPGRGKGKALELGIRESKGDFVLLLDADLGESASEGGKLLRPLLEGEADLVIARFPGKRRWGLVRLFAALCIILLGGYRPKEPLSGQRAAKRETFIRLFPFAKGYGVETGMTIDAAKEGLKIVEVQTNMLHLLPARKRARTALHKLRQLRDIALAVAERALRLK